MRFQKTSARDWVLSSFLRQSAWFVSAVCIVLCGVPSQAWAFGQPATTTLAVTSCGSTATTVTAGSVVTLTATVTAGGTPATPGQVNFCDATAKSCTDIHLLGTAQLTANGTATLKFRPGVGSHSYKAVLAEPANLGPSASTASPLTVTASKVTVPGTGQLAARTYIESSGIPNIYSLTATVPGNGDALPTGMVSFLDTSNGNAVLGTAALTAETGFGFAGSSLFPVASQNSGNTVLTADFNGDGIPDLVIFGSVISVLLGNGDGTFTAAPSPSSDSAGAIAVGDFNGDGIPDLAVAPLLDESDSEVLLGKGDGTFTIGPDDFGNNKGRVTSNSIAVGDFNGDGKLDLAETCATVNEQQCNSLLILLGNGDGTFTQSSTIPLAIFGFQSTAVGDFNGDGQLDLAVTNSGSNSVTILLGSGDGTFTSTASLVTGVSPTSIAAADFNGDGHLDLAVTNSGSNNAMILLGNGDGTFTATASPATGMAPTSVAVGDFNGDGVPDLAVANEGSSNVTILLGNGDGTFTAPASPAVDTGSTAVSLADFNGDGKEDIVVANSADSSATALLAEIGLEIATVTNIAPMGAGTHLVQAIYSGDVNYGGSTSADASLTVVQAGISLSTTPVVVTSGATAISTVTITPTSGFTGSVTLECVGADGPGSANAPPTCSSIPPVTISGNAPVTISLTIQTQPGTTPAQYQENVQANDSSGVAIAGTKVAVAVNAPPPSFALTSTPVSIALPGASGTSTITVTPSGGFTGIVTLSCSVAGPSGAVDVPGCSVAAPVSIAGTLALTATLTVNTTAASAVATATSNNIARGNPLRRILPIGGAAIAALLFLAPPVFRRRWNPWLGLLLFAVVAGAAIGCGGAMKTATPVAANPGTTAGSYTVTVTGVAGATMATTALTVTVI